MALITKVFGKYAEKDNETLIALARRLHLDDLVIEAQIIRDSKVNGHGGENGHRLPSPIPPNSQIRGISLGAQANDQTEELDGP